MNKSESILELAKALSAFQGELTSVKKDAVNPFFKSRYATLDTIWDTIRKPLAKHGLAVTQTLDWDGGLNEVHSVNLLETMLTHTSGEYISGTQLLNPVKDDPQGMGAAITYARRYSLSAILGIVSDEDDDANSASKKDKPAASEKTPTPKTQYSETKGITIQQNKKIWALAKQKGFSKERIDAFVLKAMRKESVKDLTLEEAGKLIERLEGQKDAPAIVKEATEMGAEIVD